MRRLCKWLKSYLIASGAIANLIIIACLGFVALVDTHEMRSAVRDGLPGVARLVWRPYQRFESYRANRHAARLGLTAPSDSYAYREIEIPLDPAHGHGSVLRIGPGRQFSRPSQAAAVAKPGDIIEIDPGDYHGDTALWRTDDLLIRGAGGIAHIHGAGLALVQDKAIWLVQARNVRIEHIEFSGAKSRDRNGAGIRAEGDRLHVVACFFHDNESGILSNPIAEGIMRVEYSEFARNGHSNGQAHQIYINAMREFVLRFNYIHGSFAGSAVKSRATVNRIKYNRIVDGINGSSNYTLDLADGGQAYVIGNVMEQGPRSANGELIAYAPESSRNQPQEFVVVHNTLVNDRHDGVFLWNRAEPAARVYNNLLIGAGTPIKGAGLAVGNVVVRDGWLALPNDDLGGIDGSHANRVTRGLAVRDRSSLDFRLSAASPAIDAAVLLEDSAELEITPKFEYQHPRAARVRSADDRPDAGAIESASADDNAPVQTNISSGGG